MEAAGVEPQIWPPMKMSNAGQSLTQNGQKTLKPGQTKGLSDVTHVEMRTAIGQLKSPLGPSKTTTEPQPPTTGT